MINLQETRIRAGMTQEQLAEVVGVVRQTISNIECGLTLPSITNAQAIAQVLGLNWTDFFN